MSIAQNYDQGLGYAICIAEIGEKLWFLITEEALSKIFIKLKFFVRPSSLFFSVAKHR